MYPARATLQHVIKACWKMAWQKAGKTPPFFVILSAAAFLVYFKCCLSLVRAKIFPLRQFWGRKLSSKWIVWYAFYASYTRHVYFQFPLLCNFYAPCLHLAYVLQSPYMHLIYALYKPYVKLIYTLYTPNRQLIYTFNTPYIHLVYTLHTSYIYLLWVLYTRHIRLIYILYTSFNI